MNKNNFFVVANPGTLMLVSKGHRLTMFLESEQSDTLYFRNKKILLELADNTPLMLLKIDNWQYNVHFTFLYIQTEITFYVPKLDIRKFLEYFITT